MNQRPGNSRLFVVIAAIVTLAVALVFFVFDPAVYHFYPRCVLYETTGLLCPGCGGLRATHQLLHGHVGAAFKLNPLAVVLAPIAAWVILGWGAKTMLEWKWPMPRLHRSWPWVLIAVLVVFGFARNFYLIKARIAGL